jgi:hypothetical protein
MEDLINFYQYLRGSVFLPFLIALIFIAPIVLERKTKGKVKFLSYFWFGGTAIIWLLFSIFNLVFEQSPFSAVPDIIYIGLPLLIFSINSVLFWAFSSLNYGGKNQGAL